MSDIASRLRVGLVVAWALLAGVACYLSFALDGKESVPFHLVWASFALLYGLCPWPRRASILVFALVTTVAGISLARNATDGTIAWEEFTEVILTATIVWLLMWHVNRQWSAQARLRALQEAYRERSETRENAALFGSHEVRTRLTIARGYSQLIADQSTEPRVRDDAALVVAELVKASALATNLLTLVRVLEPSSPEAVDVDRVVTACLHRWQVTADRCWSARSSVGIVPGNTVPLEVILDCLLENAVRFTGPGDSIAIVADTLGGELVLTVRDTGDGIPTAELDLVFEIFRTAPSAGKLAGSGLGLAIVKATTEAGGGTVSIASMLGEGTTVTLRFPAPLAPSTAATQAASSPDAGSPTSASALDRVPLRLRPLRR